MVNYSVSFLLSASIFQVLGECHFWWTSESPRAHVAKFYDRLRLIRSVSRAFKFSVLKLIEMLMVWVNYTIRFSFSLFWAFRASLLNFWNYFVWLRITDDGSVPEMHIWSILLIKSGLKLCKHHSRSLFLYFNNLVNVTAGGPVIPRGTCNHVLQSTSADS